MADVPTMAELLTAPDFLPPARCRGLRAAYEAGVRSGRVRPTPRAGRGAVVPLAAVTAEPAVSDLPARLAAALRGAFPPLPPLAVETALYTRMGPGDSHPLHADAETAGGTPNHTPQRVASAMLYLNDDFAGGAIYFPGLGNRAVIPRPGLMLGFLTSWAYRHAVEPVTAGTRDALAFWFRAADAPAPKPAARPSPARPLPDPYRWCSGGIERITESMENDLLGQGVRPTPTHADRLRKLAARLLALADQSAPEAT